MKGLDSDALLTGVLVVHTSCSISQYPFIFFPFYQINSNNGCFSSFYTFYSYGFSIIQAIWKIILNTCSVYIRRPIQFTDVCSMVQMYVSWSPHLCNGNLNTGKIIVIYWISQQALLSTLTLPATDIIFRMAFIMSGTLYYHYTTKA